MTTETESRCSCRCPDGDGQHLCGCTVYDTPAMTRLRADYATMKEQYDKHIASLASGRVAPSGIEAWVKTLGYFVDDLCVHAAAIAIEDYQNPDGEYSPDPWNV